ncbi:ferredoxin [Xylanimonas allomyrinae]|uniref:Ferredoxin n=1 Tax=Xylanimonas allomyrinae TaxID=2509459 RepID=A0A4P6EIF7_9MICO|nr:ferredoxin [Xylanimonas allomyrinae]QAY62282.1 ferredoxin [Xylanimonas allomyrinae]
MKICVDRDKCTVLGVCEATAPDVFEIDDDGTLVVKTTLVDAGNRDAVEAAVTACPTEALRIGEG